MFWGKKTILRLTLCVGCFLSMLSQYDASQSVKTVTEHRCFSPMCHNYSLSLCITVSIIANVLEEWGQVMALIGQWLLDQILPCHCMKNNHYYDKFRAIKSHNRLELSSFLVGKDNYNNKIMYTANNPQPSLKLRNQSIDNDPINQLPIFRNNNTWWEEFHWSNHCNIPSIIIVHF